VPHNSSERLTIACFGCCCLQHISPMADFLGEQRSTVLRASVVDIQNSIVWVQPNRFSQLSADGL